MKTSFLMIARLLYDKGYREYVDAARTVGQGRSDVEFLLLGGIDEAYPHHVPESVVRQDDASGAIRYLGYIDDVQSVIRQADCVVLPSYYNEGLSRVLMEACAMRRPIITTDISGCREAVENGCNGYLVPPKDVAALSDAFCRFLSLSVEERKRMGDYGRQKAERQFDIRNVIEVYRRITG